MFGHRHRESNADAASPCSQVHAAASDYVEGALTPSQTEEFVRHMDRCRGCWRFMEGFKLTLAILHGMPQHAAPRDFKDRLRRRFQGQSHA